LDRRVAFRNLAVLAIIAEGAYVGVALLSAQFTFEGPTAARPIVGVLTLLSVAFVAYLLALRQALRLPKSCRGVWVVIVPALLFRATMVPSLPIQEVDIYRYLWDGAVVTSSVSPYRYSPAQVAAVRTDDGRCQEDLPDDLRRLADMCDRDPALGTILGRVHFAELPTIYPSVSQAVFAAVASVTPRGASVYQRTVIMKVALTLFDLATLAVLFELLRVTGYHWGWSIAYGWCPLVMKEIAGSGHLDAIAVFLTTLAVAIVCRGANRSPVEGNDRAMHADFPPLAPPPTPPHNVADFRESVPSKSSAATLRGGGHAPTRERLRRGVAESRWRCRTATLSAAVVLALAVGAKLYPIVLAPWLLFASAQRLGLRWGMVVSGCFVLVTTLLLIPMLPSPPAEPDRQVAGSEGVPPVPESANPYAPQDPSSGLSAFLRRWEMNDLLFMIGVENLKPRSADPNAVRPWFSIVPETWRQALLQPFAARLCVDTGAAAFLLTRGLTLGLFALIAVALLIAAWRGADQIAYLRAAFLTLAWFWLLAPTQNPWYWLWPLPLLPFARSRVWLLGSGLVLVYYLRFWLYYQWPGEAVPGFGYSGTQWFDFVITWLEFGPWLLWLAVDWWWYRRGCRSKDGPTVPHFTDRPLPVER
jgi:hypothetical protein